MDSLHDRAVAWALRLVSTALVFAGVALFVAGIPVLPASSGAAARHPGGGAADRRGLPAVRACRHPRLASSPLLFRRTCRADEHGRLGDCARPDARRGSRLAAGDPPTIPVRMARGGGAVGEQRAVAERERQHVRRRAPAALRRVDPTVHPAGGARGVRRRVRRDAAASRHEESAVSRASSSPPCSCSRRSRWQARAAPAR